MVAEEYTLIEPMVDDIPFISSRIIGRVYRFDESNIHNFVIEVIHRNLCRMILGRVRRVSKDNVPFTFGFGTSHTDESVRTEGCEYEPPISFVYRPLSMVLWCKSGRRTTPAGCRTPPKDFVTFLFPGGLHMVDLFEL
jgi:hypothetical protein